MITSSWRGFGLVLVVFLIVAQWWFGTREPAVLLSSLGFFAITGLCVHAATARGHAALAMLPHLGAS